jgi:hypothetical protein
MAIRNLTMRNALATAYKNAAIAGALFSADPGTGGAATGEISGGAPAYARVTIVWNTVANSATTSNAIPFNVGSGSTVAYFGVATSATATTADVQDSVAVTSQTFNSQGTYTVTATYTQS